MSSQTIGPTAIDEITVDEASRKGTIKVGTQTYRIANNTDTGFEAMVDVLTAAVSTGKQVTLVVDHENELDRVTMHT